MNRKKIVIALLILIGITATNDILPWRGRYYGGGWGGGVGLGYYGGLGWDYPAWGSPWLGYTVLASPYYNNRGNAEGVLENQRRKLNADKQKFEAEKRKYKAEKRIKKANAYKN